MYTRVEDIISTIDKIDEWLDKCKPIIDEYQGRTKEELGDEEFNKIMCICDRVTTLMAERSLLSIALCERYGVLIM